MDLEQQAWSVYTNPAHGLSSSGGALEPHDSPPAEEAQASIVGPEDDVPPQEEAPPAGRKVEEAPAPAEPLSRFAAAARAVMVANKAQQVRGVGVCSLLAEGYHCNASGSCCVRDWVA